MFQCLYVICLGVSDTAGHYEADSGSVDGGGDAVRGSAGGVAGESIMAGMCV